MVDRQKTAAKSKPNKASMELLSSALERFSTSSRFPMLEHLTVTAFAKKDAKLPKALAGRTFGDLVHDGGASVCAARGVTTLHIARITEILSSLLDGENSPEQAHIPSAPIQKPSKPQWSKQPAIRVSSVEAEVKLTSALSKLRLSPRFSQIAMNRLGDYWDPEWVRAPFEEALTLEQLSQMKPQSLLEKRSFSTQKLLHLVAAVDKAVKEDQTREQVSQHSQPGPEIVRHSELPANPAISVAAWKQEQAALPAAVGAAIVAYEQEAKSCPVENSIARRVLTEIPLKLTAREYITATLLEEYEPSIVASMLKSDHGTVLETAKLATKKLDQALRESELGTYQALSTLLSQPAAALKLLSDVLFGTSLSESFRMSISAIIARSLGAFPVEAFGTRPAGYWSKNPQGMERAVRLLVAGLPKSDSDLKAEAHTILPGLPFEVVSDLLRSLAFYNEKARTWAKKSQ